MIFINNKYTRIYYQLINTAKLNPRTCSVETHHIIPKSLGGNDDVDNLIALTTKEHWFVHKLLIRMTTGDAKRKMWYAFGMFRVDKLGNRILTSRQYQESKEAFIKAHSKREVTDTTREKLRLSNSNQPKNHQCTHCNGWFTKGKLKQFHGNNCKLNPDIDPVILEERGSSRKICISKKFTDYCKNKPKKICEHCNRDIDVANYKQWHGDKCKFNPQKSPD